jgi:hypothetical protein
LTRLLRIGSTLNPMGVKLGLSTSSTFKKAIGSLVYDKNMLGRLCELDCETVSFEESIRRTEGA